jgi:hypothetical protein
LGEIGHFAYFAGKCVPTRWPATIW